MSKINRKFIAAMEEIYDLAGWHCDDDADENNPSPEDQGAHVNGLIRRICREWIKADMWYKENVDG